MTALVAWGRWPFFVAASAALRLARFFVAASAALRLAPSRFAPQSVLRRHGAALRRHARPSSSPPPLRFGLLASRRRLRCALVCSLLVGGSAALRLARRCVAASAALRLAPSRFAPQSVLRRHGRRIAAP